MTTTEPTAGYVRDLTADELREWMPNVAALVHGRRAVWVDDLTRDPDWEAIPDGMGHRCRWRGCGRPAVVDHRRLSRRSGGWWAYCDNPDHLGGRIYIPATSDTPAQLLRRIIIDDTGTQVG